MTTTLVIHLGFLFISWEHPFYELLKNLCDKNLYNTYFTKGAIDRIVLDVEYSEDLKEKFLKGYVEENKSFVKMDLKVRKEYNKEYSFWLFKMDLNRFDFVE